MDKKRTENISTILFGIALILLLLPAFGLFRDNMDGILFAVFLCVINGFMIRQLRK